MHTVVAAPTLLSTQASFSRNVVRGNFVAPIVYDTQASYLRMVSRGNVAVFCMPLVGRESLHEGGAQAWWPTCCIHEASVSFYVAIRSSECRHGAGEKKRDKVGASSRGVEKRNGGIKGNLFGSEGVVRSIYKK